MLIVESLFRRFGYSFGFAGLFTAMYDFGKLYYGIPLIAYILGTIFFISSWRVQKEFMRHVHFEEDENNWVDQIFYRLCGAEKHRRYIVWQACYTFGAAIMLLAAGTDLDVKWSLEVQVLAVLCLISWFAITRHFDPKAKPSYYK